MLRPDQLSYRPASVWAALFALNWKEKADAFIATAGVAKGLMESLKEDDRVEHPAETTRAASQER